MHGYRTVLERAHQPAIAHAVILIGIVRRKDAIQRLSTDQALAVQRPVPAVQIGSRAIERPSAPRVCQGGVHDRPGTVSATGIAQGRVGPPGHSRRVKATVLHAQGRKDVICQIVTQRLPGHLLDDLAQQQVVQVAVPGLRPGLKV